MAENSGFFASVGGDRQYTTDFLAHWIASIIGNGVYNGELAVTAGDGMTVTLPAGRAWINGYYYRNDGDMTLTIDNADGVLNRVDIVVLRWDVNARSITAQVIKGTPASTAAAPAITRTTEQYDLKLAEISIPAGTTAITQSLITDTRLDNDVCGVVTGVIDQVDTTTLFNQYVDWYTTTTGQAETDIEAIKQQFQSDINQFLQDWQDWYTQTTQQAETDINSIIQQLQDNLTQFEQDWNNWFSQQQTEGFVMAVEKGQPNGIATLDENGKVPDEQLPEIEVPVTSVNGKTGDVELDAADVGAASKEDFESHKNEKAPHQYGGVFEWRYNPNANSLDLVVIE